MNNENNENLLPETNQQAPNMHYADLKYPLTRRGIEVPAAMNDYIEKLSLHETMNKAELEEIREEMKEMFRQSAEVGADAQEKEAKIPEDFDANFDQWFGVSNP